MRYLIYGLLLAICVAIKEIRKLEKLFKVRIYFKWTIFCFILGYLLRIAGSEFSLQEMVDTGFFLTDFSFFLTYFYFSYFLFLGQLKYWKFHKSKMVKKQAER